MPIDWADYELHDPPQTNGIDWSAYEPHEEQPSIPSELRTVPGGYTVSDIGVAPTKAPNPAGIDLGMLTGRTLPPELETNPMSPGQYNSPQPAQGFDARKKPDEFQPPEFVSPIPLDIPQTTAMAPGQESAPTGPAALPTLEEHRKAEGFGYGEDDSLLPLGDWLIKKKGAATGYEEGINESLRNNLNGLVTPRNVAYMLASMGLAATGPVGAALVSAFWTVLMGSHQVEDLPEKMRQLGDEMGKPEDQRDKPKIARILTDTGIETALTTTPALHTAKTVGSILHPDLPNNLTITGKSLETPEGSKPIIQGEPNAISIRGAETLPIQVPPAGSEAVGEGISGTEKPALPQEQAPVEATPESAGTLKSGDIDPVMGARYDGEIMGKKMFTAMLPDGKEGTTFMVEAGATPEQMRAKYQEVRERFKGDKFEPRALPDEKAATEQADPIKFAALKGESGKVYTGQFHPLIEQGMPEPAVERGFQTKSGKFVPEESNQNTSGIDVTLRGDLAADEIQDPHRRLKYAQKELEQATNEQDKAQLEKLIEKTRKEIQEGAPSEESAAATPPETRVLTKQVGNLPAGTEVKLTGKSSMEDALNQSIQIKLPDGTLFDAPPSWISKGITKGKTLPGLIAKHGRQRISELLGEWEGDAELSPDGKFITTFSDPRNRTGKIRASTKEFLKWLDSDEAPPIEPPQVKPQSDYDRYQELAKSIKGKTLDEAQSIQKELETIKNRNGGMPPKPAEGGGIGGGLKAAIENNKNNEGGFVNLDGAIDFGRNVFDKVKDFAVWGSELVKRAGDWIKPHLQELWQYVRNEHPEQIAKDTGWTFKKNDAPAVNMEGMPPEMVAQFKAQFKPQWEFTDRRVGSPTEGITFYTPENATRNEVINRMDQKVAEATGKPTGDLQYRHAGIPIPGVTTLTEGVKSLGEGIRKLADQIINPEKRDAISRYFQGHSAPKTMAASEASGNALARYAAAQDAAPFIAQSMALDVLGDNAKNEPFRKRLGAVLVEDRLRAIKQKFIDAANKATSLTEKAKLTAKANKVTTLVGKEFSSNADFLNAIKDPEIAAAIERHKKSVQVEAQKFHEETGGEVSGPGLHTGAFVNLEALTDEAPLNFGTGGRGDYTKPLKRKSVFSREAQGTGKKYELDYNRLAERMIRGNYDEFTKRQMYNQLVKDGLAQILPANESAPEIGGQKAQKFPIQRKVVVANGRTIPQYENLWVRHDIASEVESAFNLGSMVKNTNLAAVGRVLNRLQLAGPTDAVWHMANILSAIAGKQGGKLRLIDMARKFPGVNVIDAGVRIGFKAREVLAQNPDIIRDMAELAKIGAARPEHLESGFNSRFIKVLDKAARLIRNDMFDNLAKRGVITDTSEGARREFVNQVGQYNPRLAGVYQRIFKESGLSPFIVAGRNFNRAGMRAVTLSPGYKAANMSEAIKGRVIEGLGVVATLVAVPTLFNMILTGTPNGRPGTQFGQIDTGKDDAKGNHIVVDPAQWVGLRRGMRVTGLNALINGARAHKPGSEIKQDMRNDMIGAITHPWMGPTAQFPLIAATGKNAAGFTESENTKDFGKNVKAAIQNINPVLHAFWNKNDNTLAGKGGDAMKSLTGAIGVKTAATLSPTSAIQNRAKSWGLSSENPKIKTAFEQREKEDFGESKYKPLATALRLNKPEDAANEINKILLEETTEKDRAKAKQLILKRFDPFTKVKGNIRAKVFLTPSGAMEQAYKASMNDEDRELYKQAVRDKVAAYRSLTQVLYGAPRNPPLLDQSGLR